MQATTALFADTAWQRLLAREVALTVASVFPSTLNLVSQRTGAWYTVFTKNGYHAPRALTVNASLPTRVGETVRVVDGTLRFPNIVVYTAGCAFTENDIRKQKQPLVEHIAFVADWVRKNAMPGSFYGAATGNVVNEATVAKLVAARTGFMQAVDRASGIARAVQDMLGLGVGLTPSGDDYLVGWLAATHQTGSDTTTQKLVSDAIRAQLTKTTGVSQLYLHEATQGNFAAPIRALAEAMAHGSPRDIAAAAHVLLRHGATSGQDMLAGMIDGWNINHKERHYEI